MVLGRFMLQGLDEVPVLGILRGVPEWALEPLIDVSVTAGLRVLELAVNTAGADALLERLCLLAKDRLLIGAGTVTDRDRLNRALAAGARFVVMPGLVSDVVAECVDRGVPVLPGAFTPTEVLLAHRAGAALVKVFPASTLGPGFFRELQGPLSEVPLLACGGVDEGNASAWISAGAAAVAIGAGTYQPAWIESRQWHLIGARLSKIVEAATDALRTAKSLHRTASCLRSQCG